MQKTLLAFSAIVLAATSQAENARFYVGTYTDGPQGGKGVYTATLDTATGKLAPVSLAAAGDSPNFWVVSKNGKFAYASLGRKTGEVGAYTVQPDGSLKLLNVQPSGGDIACQISLDAADKHVFVSNFGTGDVSCFPIQPDGSLGAASDHIKLAELAPGADHPEKPHAHCATTDAQDRFAYICDLGSDKIWTFDFDSGKGTLTLAAPPSVSTPAGSGPRHIVFSPNGRFAYVNNESGLSVTTLARDEKTGALTPLETVSTLPAEAKPIKATTGEIACHPSGKWLYVSNRGADNIAVFAIAEDGRLTLIQNAPSEVQFPRAMGLDPSGRWLVTAGQNDSRIAVLKVDEKTGLLSATDQSASIPTPVSVTFAP